jgi:hypothetical protein
LADDGTRWVPTHPAFLFPVKAWGTVFRAKFLAALAHAHTTAALTFNDTTAAFATPQGFALLLDQLSTTAWVVYAKAPFAGPAQVVDYLGRYTHRIAITNTRLVDVRDGQVCFTYRNRRNGDTLEQMTVDAHTFLRRFLLHVLPTGFVRLRHYGFLANRCTLILDSRVLCDQELNERTKQRFASLSDVVHKLKEAQVKWELLLWNTPMRPKPAPQ